MRGLRRTITAPFRFVKNIGKRFSSTWQGFHEFFTEEPEDTPLPDAFAKTVENPMGILVHLDILRQHLLRSVVYLIITTALSFTFSLQIMEFLARPLEGGLDTLRAIEITESIGTVMKVSLLAGFAIAFPFIALELWLFIAPGVSRHSRILGLLAIPIATLFFIGGMAFAYYVMMPVALPFLLGFMGLETIPRPYSYFNFTTSLLFWIGAAFEFPLVIYILANMGIVNSKMLFQQWRLAVVIISIVSAMITPTLDPVNMALVMAPMILLYFFSIGLAKIAQRGREPAR